MGISAKQPVVKLKDAGIYILTNKIDRMQYIGKGVRVRHRPEDHLSLRNPTCRKIHNAIKKYGRENFDVEIIFYPGITHEALDAIERWKISKLNTVHPRGYNLTSGGDHGKYSRQTSIKMSRSRKGIPLGPMPEERKKKIGDANRGKKRSQKVRDNISKNKRKENLSKETQKKMSDSQRGNKNAKGHRFTLQQRLRMSANRKGRNWKKPVGIITSDQKTIDD